MQTSGTAPPRQSVDWREDPDIGIGGRERRIGAYAGEAWEENMTGVDARGPGRPRGAHARPLSGPADGGGSDDRTTGDRAADHRAADHGAADHGAADHGTADHGTADHGTAGGTVAAGSIVSGTGARHRADSSRGSAAHRPGQHGAAASRWLVPVIPALLGLVTGGYRLGVPPLWRDEAATKAIAGRSVGQIVATMPHDDVVHFAYYLVVHVVIRVFGDSNAALRLPSVIAMAVAAGFTALIARRLARSGGRWYADGTGLLAGVVFALLPAVIRYAQEARSYAVVTMLAAIASYLLLRALDGGGRGRWAAYGAAVFLTGLFNIFGLLILAAHGVTVLATGRLGSGGGPAARPAGRRLAGMPLGWIIAGAIAAVLLVPLGLIAYAQRDALSWMSTTPIVTNIVALTRFWPGSAALAGPVFGLAGIGVVASLIAWRRALSAATVALPWLVVPPAILLAVSTSHPVYDERYVEYCLPALAICVAFGVTWLWRAVVIAVPRVARSAWLGWLAAVPALAACVALIVALQPAAAVVRQPGYRPDNLERESAIVAANARPGDIVFYIPVNDRIVSMPFPGPWRELRDIALAVAPVASNTLYGTDVSPAVLLSRFSHVTRVWLVSSADVPLATYLASPQATALDREEARLIGEMRLVHRWRDSDTELTLYATR
jgi:mannosyltransferase